MHLIKRIAVISALAGLAFAKPGFADNFQINASIPSPTGLAAIAYSNNITLSWTNTLTPTATVSPFTVIMRATGNTTLASAFSQVGTTNFPASSYIDSSGLQPGLTYSYMVATCYGNTCSNPSNQIAVVYPASSLGSSSSTSGTSTVTSGSTSGSTGTTSGTSGSTTSGSGSGSASSSTTTSTSSGSNANSSTTTGGSTTSGNTSATSGGTPASATTNTSGTQNTIPTPTFTTSKTISGTVKFSDSTPVTNGEVGAYSSFYRQWTSQPTATNGSFTLKVGPGTWKLGLRPLQNSAAQWSYQNTFPEITFALDNTAESQAFNFTVPAATAQLHIHAQKKDNSPAYDVGIIIDTRSASNSTGSTEPEHVAAQQFAKTDANGNTAFYLAPGTYFVRAFLPPQLGFLQPGEQQIALNAGDSQSLTFTFHNAAAAPAKDFTMVKGTTKLNDGTPVSALVWAWSDKGDSTQTRSDDTGSFSIKLDRNSIWHIGAEKDYDNIPYQAPPAEISTDFARTSVSLVLVPPQNAHELKQAESPQTDPTKPVEVETDDGAAVKIPASTAPAAAPVTVVVKPTVEAPSQPNQKVVSTVYDITLSDTSGMQYKQFSKDIEIDLPYDPAELAAHNLTPEIVTPSYYDDASGTWVKASNYTIDKDKHIFIVHVQHLTRFALVAAADITPPEAPVQIRASARTRGQVTLTWKNPNGPTIAFVKIYRSSKRKQLGDVLATSIINNSFADTNVKAGKRYYYTVRAVSIAGNESTNTDQVSARPLSKPKTRSAK